MKTIWKDLSFALRSLRKKPWLSAAIILELALGIGANVAIFSIINSLYLQPLPFSDADRLYQIEQVLPDERGSTFGGERFAFWRDHGENGYEAITAYNAYGHDFKVRTREGTEVIHGFQASGDFFRVFGGRPQKGRVFGPEDDEPGAPLVAVISDNLWEREFGRDPEVIGRTLTIDGDPTEIIGVMAADFQFSERSEVWTPLRLEPGSRASTLRVSARRAAGTSAVEAISRLDSLDRQYRGLQPGQDSFERLEASPLQDFLYGSLRPALSLLLGAVGVVLLIACANAANLQLARSVARHREIAIRVALGAKPVQIVGLLLVESLFLGMAGGLLGLGICFFTLGPLLNLAPAEVGQQLAGVKLDLAVLAFAVGVSLLTGLLVGLLPALQACRTDVQETIKEESTGSGASGGRGGWRVRYGMVVLEIALALILMISAGLLTKSLAGLRAVPLGFHADHLLTFKAHLTGRYSSHEVFEAFQGRVLGEIEALPGVRRGAVATSLPLELGADMPFVIRDGVGDERAAGIAQYRGVSPGYFETLDIALVRGRALSDSDRSDAPLVAVINETAARRYFPETEALGQRIVIGLPDMPEQADRLPREIVGIVRDVRESGPSNEAPAILYVPAAQIPESLTSLLIQLLPLNVIVRGEGDPGGLVRVAQRAVWNFDPDLPISDVATMDSIIARSVGSQSFQMMLITTLAALALMLSVLGTYAVLTYQVSQQTRELGLRMALGGAPRRITADVVRQGMRMVLIGIGLGLAGAWLATRIFASFLYGVNTTDPTTFALVTLLMIAFASLATLVPARRAARISVMEALRWP